MMNSSQLEKMTDLLLLKRANNLKRILDIKHRLQSIAVIDEVEYINDSKSTNITATTYSLQCMDEKVVWIVDSHALRQDFALLIDCVQEKVKKIIAIGPQAEGILATFPKVDGMAYSTLKEAMIDIGKSKFGDIVLFSPACPTDERYEDYRQRGMVFTALVNEMKR